MKRIVLLIVILLIICVLIKNKKELFTQLSKNKVKKIMIWRNGNPPITTDKFRFKSWDGTNYTCKIINNEFFVRPMGSNQVFNVRVINILRFRSQQWQVALVNNKFIVSRFGGTIGMEFTKLDLVDWDDTDYTIKVIS